MTSTAKLIAFDQPLDKDTSSLLLAVRGIITTARREVLRAVDDVQVRSCWEIGRHIVEHEQNGAERADYGAKLIPNLAKKLTGKFGKGFDERNLRNMRAFYQMFPNRNAVRTELSWTHYRSLLRVELEAARHWYMNEAAQQNWSSRALDRQIGTLYYERLLVSRDRAPVRSEADELIKPLQGTPREIVRDPVMLEFLGIPTEEQLREELARDYLASEPGFQAHCLMHDALPAYPLNGSTAV